MDNVLYIGIDLGRSTRIALVDTAGTIVKQDRVATELINGRALVDKLIDLTKQMKAEAHLPIAAVGLAVSGLVDYQSQQVKVLPNLPDVSNINIHHELVQAIGLPVIIDNDANAATYGEWRCGAALNMSDVIYIYLGTGIGSGLVLNGQLQHGVRGFAGEFGHMKVGGEQLDCSCGSQGCLETIASGPNIVRRTREQLFIDPCFTLSTLSPKMTGKLTCEDVVEAARSGDKFARTILLDTAGYLGMTIANVVNLLNLEIVVLGGPVMVAGEFLLNAIKEATTKYGFAPLLADCQVVGGNLSNDAGVIGAAMMAYDIVMAMRQ